MNAFQKQLLDTIKNGEQVQKSYKDRSINVYFDTECINDDCSGRNGTRAKATAWKLDKNWYELYCTYCGQTDKIDKDEFKEKKTQFSREQAHYNMEKQKLEKQKVDDE